MSIVNTSLVEARESSNENYTDTTNSQNSILHQGKYINISYNGIRNSLCKRRIIS